MRARWHMLLRASPQVGMLRLTYRDNRLQSDDSGDGTWKSKSTLPNFVSCDPPTTSSTSSHTAGPSTAVWPPSAKKAKTAAETVQELNDLKDLKDQGLQDSPEFKNLKCRILRGD